MNPTIDLGRQRKGTTEEERKQKGERGSFLRPDPGSCYDILFHFRVSEGWHTKKSHPFSLLLHAMDTKLSANLSSTHRDRRAGGSSSTSLVPMKHDSDISGGPRGCTVPARMAVPLCS